MQGSAHAGLGSVSLLCSSTEPGQVLWDSWGRSQCCQLPSPPDRVPHHTWLLFTADLHTLPRNLTSPPALLHFSPQRPLRSQLMGTSTISLVLCPALWIPGCWDSTGWVCCCSQHHQLPPLLSAPKLQEKERSKAGQKKSLSSLQQLEEEGFSEQSGVDVNAAKALQVCGATGL